MCRLVNLKYRDNKSINEHTSEFQDLVNQLATAQMDLEDELQALLLLSSLPKSWETLVVSLNNSAPDGKLTMSGVKDALLHEEARRRSSDQDIGQALISETKQYKGQGK